MQDDLETRVLRTSFGHKLGRIASMGLVPSGFGAAEIALIDHSDMVTKEVHIGESRYMGGPYDEHVKDMLILYQQIGAAVEQEYGIRLQARIRDPLSIIPHDVVEDDQGIKELRDALRAIKSNGSSAESQDGENSIIGMIKEQREKIVNSLYRDMLGSIQSLSRDGKDVSGLGLETVIALGAVDWLTRHTEDREYYQSVYHLCRMHKKEDYIKGLRGGPFQKEVMGLLGASPESFEPTDYFAMRVFLKLLDRISLARERKPRFEDEEAGELEQACQQNEWLKAMYGENVNFRAENIPGLYVMKLLYRNYIVLNNVNMSLNEYGIRIAEEKEKSPAAYAYLLGIIKAREMLLEESIKMAAELRHRYESSLGEEKAAQIREEMDAAEKANPAQFEVITGEGPISRGSRYDPMPRHMLGEMDETEAEENYKDAIGFEKLQQRFSDPA
ncbi:MAG: hypothetical protein AABX63_03390, partial [Nanoarchaeota archaeon]